MLLRPLLLLLAASARSARALLFTPQSRTDYMADLWLYRDPRSGSFLLNYLVQSNSTDEHCAPPTWCAWNGVSSAWSNDGVHFTDLGVVLRKDCAGGQQHASERGPQAPDCATWLGSGSVWPLLNGNRSQGVSGRSADGAGGDEEAEQEWVMNYSQEYDCQESCSSADNGLSPSAAAARSKSPPQQPLQPQVQPPRASGWVVQNNTDYPHNAPDGPGVVGPYMKADNASACAEACLQIKDCAAISWNGPGSQNSDHCCNFKCDTTPSMAPQLGQQGIVVRPGGKLCPPPKPAPPPPRPPSSTGAGTNSSRCNCQSIFFATSKDLRSWTPVSPDAERHPSTAVFKYAPQLYFTAGANAHQSRWDCMSAIHRPGGGYYAYWTASPISKAGSCDKTTVRPPGPDSCGAGFGESDDGLNWRALPSPGPTYASAELGGVAVVGGLVWMLFDQGHLFRATSPHGPFVPTSANFDFLDQSVGVGFPRFWGAVYTGDANLTLLTHNQMLRTTTYAALTKKVEVGADGVLRVVWWEGNDALRGAPLPVTPSRVPGVPAATNTTSCIHECLTSGLWLDGALSRKAALSGVWLQTTSAATNTTSGVAFMFDTGTVDGLFRMGVLPSATANATALRTVVDRAMRQVAPGHEAPTFRLVVRNSYTDAAMVEFYVNGVLGQAFSVGIRGAAASAAARLTGAFAVIGGAELTAVHRLTLPRAEAADASGHATPSPVA
jgi:hypothetical protein